MRRVKKFWSNDHRNTEVRPELILGVRMCGLVNILVDTATVDYVWIDCILVILSWICVACACKELECLLIESKNIYILTFRNIVYVFKALFKPVVPFLKGQRRSVNLDASPFELSTLDQLENPTQSALD